MNGVRVCRWLFRLIAYSWLQLESAFTFTFSLSGCISAFLLLIASLPVPSFLLLCSWWLLPPFSSLHLTRRLKHSQPFSLSSAALFLLSQIHQSLAFLFYFLPAFPPSSLWSSGASWAKTLPYTSFTPYYCVSWSWESGWVILSFSLIRSSLLSVCVLLLLLVLVENGENVFFSIFLRGKRKLAMLQWRRPDFSSEALIDWTCNESETGSSSSDGQLMVFGAEFALFSSL